MVPPGLLRDFPPPAFAQDFFESFSASASHHECSLNPVFLVQIPTIEAFNRRPIWLLRDGLLPIFHFFRQFPQPGPINSEILVDSSLASLVPAAWSSQVRLYRVICCPPKRSPAQFLIYGPVLVDDHYLEINREALRPVSRLRPARDRVYCHLAIRNELWVSAESVALNYYSRLAREIGPGFEPVEWMQILFRLSFQGVQLLPINNRLIADHYLTHLVLPRGGYLESTPRKSHEDWVPLSPFHGYAISKINRKTARKAANSLDPEHSLASIPWFRHWLLEISRPVQPREGLRPAGIKDQDLKGQQSKT